MIQTKSNTTNFRTDLFPFMDTSQRSMSRWGLWTVTKSLPAESENKKEKKEMPKQWQSSDFYKNCYISWYFFMFEATSKNHNQMKE